LRSFVAFLLHDTFIAPLYLTFYRLLHRACWTASRRIPATPASRTPSVMGMADYSYHALANLSPQGRWRRVLLVAMIPMALVLIYYSYPHSYIPTGFRSSQ
jgi:hypothetical protein